MRLLLLAVALLFCGCGKPKPGKPVDTDLSPLLPRFLKYSALYAEHSAPRNGWTYDGCDDTKHTGIARIFTPVDLTAARIAPGEWTRNRFGLADCYDKTARDGRRLSGSRTSRDMALGEAWWMYLEGRKDLAAEVLDYVDSHNGLLGPGDKTRTDMRPGLKGTFQLIAGRGGWEKDVPLVVGGIEVGYERELSAWHFELRAELEGGMRDYKDWFERNAREQPHNPLYQYQYARYVTGRWQAFLDAAMDPAYWPEDHLPTTDNYCTPHVIQRDMGHDWTPPCLDGGGQPVAFQVWPASDYLAVLARALQYAGLL